jgi:acetyltransferase-like isoleucine patch superfamily enzyme
MHPPGMIFTFPSMSIGRGSVVTKDVPDRAIAYGNPACIVGKAKDEEII